MLAVHGGAKLPSLVYMGMYVHEYGGLHDACEQLHHLCGFAR